MLEETPMNKQFFCAAAFLWVGGTCHAQASITIYGLLDTAVEHINHVGATGSGLTRIPSNAGNIPSRLGFRGREDLGGGISAQFVLEMGIAPDSGVLNQGGRGFGRQSFVGLNGPWGQVGLGRQYTMLFWSMHDADVIGPGMHSIANFDSYFPNARADNAISYKGTFSGLTLGMTYSFGRDTVNAGPSPAGTNCAGESGTDRNACREWSMLLKYDSASWGTALAHDVLKGSSGAFGGLSQSSMSDKRTMLNGYVKFNGIKIGAGFLRRDNDGYKVSPRSDLWFVGLSYPAGAWTFDTQYYRLQYKSNSDKGQFMVLRGTYHFSKRTAAYASLGHMKNSGNATFSASSGQAGGLPVAGINQTGFGVGIRHMF